MTAIYSSAALKTRQREIKDIARRDVVHITENGNAAFVFMSEDLFEEQLNKAAEEAALTERMRACIKASDDCFEQGEYIEGTDAFFSALDERLAANGYKMLYALTFLEDVETIYSPSRSQASRISPLDARDLPGKWRARLLGIPKKQVWRRSAPMQCCTVLYRLHL